MPSSSTGECYLTYPVPQCTTELKTLMAVSSVGMIVRLQCYIRLNNSCVTLCPEYAKNMKIIQFERSFLKNMEVTGNAYLCARVGWKEGHKEWSFIL